MTNEELCLRYQSGNMEAGNALLSQNMGLVCTIVRQMTGAYPTAVYGTEDYMQEGLMALLRAAERFDPKKGDSFAAYASGMIRNAIRSALRAAFSGPKTVPLAEDDDFIESPETGGEDEWAFNHRTGMLSGDPYHCNPEQIHLQKEQMQRLYAVLNALPSREKAWLWKRYGFTDDKPRTLAEMLEFYEITKTRALLLEASALGQVKKGMRGEQS